MLIKVVGYLVRFEHAIKWIDVNLSEYGLLQFGYLCIESAECYGTGFHTLKGLQHTRGTSLHASSSAAGRVTRIMSG